MGLSFGLDPLRKHYLQHSGPESSQYFVYFTLIQFPGFFYPTPPFLLSVSSDFRSLSPPYISVHVWRLRSLLILPNFFSLLCVLYRLELGSFSHPLSLALFFLLFVTLAGVFSRNL
ncbi:hypothetical protein BDV28DRAFT_17498 [Aspergillus coremiiformis]|uniref:Uncharacterized protein n=1 Tax=Aspergillus coremiiformis TaxID=138285 RepID=A0A5N6Z3C9_9EURO|nr:hypothetical protein BDV28DRAFT_17498 [Aspergillus coremiiformis]